MILLLLLTTFFIIACGIKYRLDRKTFLTLNLDYRESKQGLKNPERGWYSIVGCRVNDDEADADAFTETLEKQCNEGDTLVLVLFNLAHYRNSNISRNGLQYIDRMIKNVKKAGLKAIIRFEYDWDGKGKKMEPDRIDTVLKHMEQVGPILNKNKNAIYLLQGIFVGSYGEMNGSKFLNEENFKTLLNAYLNVTDDSLQLSVRTSAYWRAFAQSNEPLDSYTTHPYARIGLYNDGLCSSDSDLGTYSDGSSIDQGYIKSWNRQEELDFQSHLCQYVPNGGEMAVLSTYNDLDRIINEFPVLHISYLNRMYNSEVLDKWKRTIYYAKDSKDSYNGVDGYQYIGDHLGYRFVLKKVTIPKKVYSTGKAVIQVAIENTGFSNLYHKKRIDLILQNKDTKECLTYSVDADARNLTAGAISSFAITVPTMGINEGTYEMYLKIYEEGGSSIRMANNKIYHEDLQANAIGDLKIQKFTLLHLWDFQ
jgi:hypothetical protein